MFCSYTVIEFAKNDEFIDLGKFYGKYEGSYFFYQKKKMIQGDDDENFYVYAFHLNKSDCTEEDERGNLLPILMCYVSKKGIALPNEIIKDIRSNDNKIFFYNNGYADFMLSAKKLEMKGLSSVDDKTNINFFKF